MNVAQPLTIRGRTTSLTFPGRLFLAPMEGITDPLFRDVVIPRGGVGGAVSEFIRISVAPVPQKVIRRYLGPNRHPTPVGAQLMAADADHLVATVANAERVGAPWIDLNFGCPAPVVFSKCAGSALLNHPGMLARIARTAVEATGLPVSAKIRAGVTDDRRLHEILIALVEAGVAMITLHARLRVHGYHQPAQWSWIAQAREVIAGRVPLIGNGAVESVTDVQRMFDETGCDGVMIGRAALADPWLFAVANGGGQADPAAAAAFVLEYAEAIRSVRGDHVALLKLKQLTRWYRAGGIFAHADGETDRQLLLRSSALEPVLAWYSGRL